MKISLRRAIVVPVLVAALGLSACSGGSGDDTADTSKNRTGAMDNHAVGTQFKATEPLSFSVLYNDPPGYPYKKDWLLWKAMTERTNVTLQPTVVPLSDYEQKRSLLVSAGDAPLIIPKTYPGQESAYVSSGAILPVSDYLDLMPNFQAKIKQWKLEPEIDTLRQQDGKFYLLPGLHEEVWPDYTLNIRADIFKQQGIPVPKTWDELAAALAKLKQAYPDKIPFSDRYQGKNLLNLIGTAYGTAAGWGYGDGAVWNQDAGEFKAAATMPQYGDMVAYLNKLVSDKLLDPETFTQQDDQAIQKFVTGQSFVISGNSQEITTYRKTMDSTLGKGKYEVARILVPGGPAGQLMGGSRLENGVMINAKAKEQPNFVAMMQFVDWLWYSDAGQMFAKWGVEGTTYQLKDGKPTLLPGIDYNGLNPGAGKKDLRKDFGFSGGVFAYGGSTELLHSMMVPAELKWQEEMAATHKPVPVEPPYPLSDADREQATLVNTPLTDFVNQQTLKFVLGQRPMNQWDAFVQELNGKGAEKYLKMVNDAHATYEKDHGGK
jgi:putative aldouronate transport system substrate-binding protein